MHYKIDVSRFLIAENKQTCNLTKERYRQMNHEYSSISGLYPLLPVACTSCTHLAYPLLSICNEAAQCEPHIRAVSRHTQQRPLSVSDVGMCACLDMHVRVLTSIIKRYLGPIWQLAPLAATLCNAHTCICKILADR